MFSWPAPGISIILQFQVSQLFSWLATSTPVDLMPCPLYATIFMTCPRHHNSSDGLLQVFQLFAWPAPGINYSHYLHELSQLFSWPVPGLLVILMTCSSYPNYSPVPSLPVFLMICSRYHSYSDALPFVCRLFSWPALGILILLMVC